MIFLFHPITTEITTPDMLMEKDCHNEDILEDIRV